MSSNQIVLLFIFLLFLASCSKTTYVIDNSENSIIEQKRIGTYSLSMTKNQLDSLKNVEIDQIHTYTTYTLLNVKIWYDDKRNRTDQICACNDYKGEFKNEISVGDYITDLSKIGEYYFDEEELLYRLKSVKGISFDVPENHLDLNLAERKIDYICIYR